VRALRHAREQRRRQAARADTSTPPRALVVAMPTTPGLPSGGRLAFVDDEVAALHAYLPDHQLLRQYEQSEQSTGSPAGSSGPTPTPTFAEVLARLPECAIAHFACHGDSHPSDPSMSRLLLADHAETPLTVASLAPVHLERAELAYLSACRTAAVDAGHLSDEAIHLASAFHLIGFPHVIGTLWEINDETAATVAHAFYAGLRDAHGRPDTDRAPYALHAAIRAVRDTYPRTPTLWAAHLHAGA
nr:CHAT domain-containing protein [Streptomyces sp. SID4944]